VQDVDKNPNRLEAADSAQRRLFQRLVDLGIAVTIEPYPIHRTVEEGKALRGQMAGQFTKNLLLKDKKNRLFLVAAHEDLVIDLKTLHKRIDASGQLRFAPAEEMRTTLGVEPGALTPLGIINDGGIAVTIVVDVGLLAVDQINFHPLIQAESLGIRPTDFLKFVESCDREPLLIDFNSA